MAVDIVVRSRRDREQSLEANRRDASDSPRKAVDPARAANDNDEAWPLLPFPDGCYGC